MAKLAAMIDWGFLEQKFGAAFLDAPGHPPLPTRLMAGLAIPKHMHDLSDDATQFKRARRQFRRLRMILGRVMRDIARKIRDIISATRAHNIAFI